MPAVTLTALACAAALLASADDRDALLLSPAWGRSRHGHGSSCSRSSPSSASSARALSPQASATWPRAAMPMRRPRRGKPRVGGAGRQQPWQQLGDIASRTGRRRRSPRLLPEGALEGRPELGALVRPLDRHVRRRSRAVPSRRRSSSTATRGRTSRRAMLRVDPLANPEPLIKRVYAYVAYRVGAGPDAEDLTSETFERALRYKKSYDSSKGEPIAWLIGIARRCIEGRPPSLRALVRAGRHRRSPGPRGRDPPQDRALRRGRASGGTRPRADRAPLRRRPHGAPDRRAARRRRRTRSRSRSTAR